MVFHHDVLPELSRKFFNQSKSRLMTLMTIVRGAYLYRSAAVEQTYFRC
jgi:hypothetical protein